MRVERLRQAFDVEVQWVYFPLHPDTPTDGLTLEALFAGRGMDIAAMQARMRGLMADEGLDYGQRTHTYNSRLAQELARWADDKLADSSALHDALYRAYFVDAKNIGDVEVLVELARSAGLDADEAREVLSSRNHSDAIDEDWRKAHSYGVTGVPTFVAGGRGAVGAQPYEALERLVAEAGAERR